jgi:riboflavin kinase/FMN adenylyltransferase
VEIFRTSNSLKGHLSQGSSLTVGTFDGVHQGHKRLIEYTVKKARERGLKSIVLTFEPHPIYVLRPEIRVERIALPKEKIQRLSKFGLDYLLILNFNKKLVNFTAMRFFSDILVGDLNAKFIALGYNHTFGKNREGNLEFLKQVAPDRGVDVSAVEPFYLEQKPVSSSRIRNAIKDGDMEKANRMLNEPFTLPGVIVKGKGLGRDLGFPTINVKVDEGKLMPKPGVYAATCDIGEDNYKGMMYIHPQPENCDLEVNLFDFECTIYDKRAVVVPRKFTRESIRFDNHEELKKRLALDEKEIKRYFGIE